MPPINIIAGSNPVRGTGSIVHSSGTWDVYPCRIKKPKSQSVKRRHLIGCAMLSTNHTSYTVLMIHGTVLSNLKNLVRV